MTISEADLQAARKYLQDKITDCLPGNDEACERVAFAVDRLVTVHVGLMLENARAAITKANEAISLARRG